MAINPSKYIIKLTEDSSLRQRASYATRKFVTRLDKSGAMLPVILLEATVTGGRTYQAYKRDGFVEARERVTEETLGAVFWLYGAVMFGKLFDKLGEKFGKIPKNMPDVGKDPARGPFKNFIKTIVAKMPGMTETRLKQIENRLAGFSIGKTAASIITACLFIGYVVPKVNQGITKHLFGKMKNSDPEHQKGPNPYTNKLTLKEARSIFSAKDVSINAVENFKAREDAAAKDKKNPSFKGFADSALRIVQNFEENNVWKLLGTDVGTVSGRSLNARNKDERVEIMFRDISSIYFYCFSMPAIVKFMNNKDVFGGGNTKLNPMSAMEVHNGLVERMAQMKKAQGINEMTPEQFKRFALGKELTQNETKILEEAFPIEKARTSKKVFFNLFNKTEKHSYKKVINLEEFEKIIDSKITNKARAQVLKNRAKAMSAAMQPLKEGVAVLTQAQAEDVFKGGFVRNPKFMSDVIGRIFEKKLIDVNDVESLKKAKHPLTNGRKYIPLNEIEDRRKRILGYVESIVDEAKWRKGNVTWESMLKMNKRNMHRNGMFMALAMGVSALFLSTIIPKAQYYITYLRTGKNSFPGTENMVENKK